MYLYIYIYKYIYIYIFIWFFKQVGLFVSATRTRAYLNP